MDRTMEINHVVRLDGSEILNLLYQAGIEVPEDAEVVFETPVGGDYSGQQVDVTEDNCVRVMWTEES